MSAAHDTNEPHAILGVGAHLLAVPSSAVEELFVLPVVHRAPGGGPNQRGVLSLRGRILPVFDVRRSLGLAPADEELDALVRLLQEREEDHRSWLAELEASVREARTFQLTTDPHKCRFGRWYDTYRTDNFILAAELARFAAPHAAVHALGDEVIRLVAEKRPDEALARIEQTRAGTLAELLVRFSRAREIVRTEHRELGVVVAVGGRSSVLTVDRAEAVAPIEPFAGEDDPVSRGLLETPLVRSLARWRERPTPLLLLDLPALVGAA